jgi:PEP-CTERM motif
MSWKLLVSAGLLCVLVSPAFGAPSVGANLLGLDTNGNWVWQLNASPDASLFQNSGASGTPPNTVGGSIGLEVGVAATQRNLVSAGKNSTNFPNDNPGTPIGAGFPINTNTTSLGLQVLANNAAVNLGSTFLTTGLAQEAARFHVQGPTSTALSTTLTLSGAYAGKGRIAQNGANNDIVTGANIGTVRAGNAKLEPTVGAASFALLLANFGGTGKHWQSGDFNGDGNTNASDFAILLANFGGVDPYWTAHSGSILLAPTPGAGAGAGVSSAVPEPASIVLLGLAGLFAVAWRVRRGR